VKLLEKHPGLRVLVVGEGTWKERYCNLKDKRVIVLGKIQSEIMSLFFNVIDLFIPDRKTLIRLDEILKNQGC
jgi:hypothetical protein